MRILLVNKQYRYLQQFKYDGDACDICSKTLIKVAF